MNVLLFGATGNIGSAIAGELVARGHRVTAASRRGGGVDGLDVAVRRADAADPVQVAEAATRQDAIVSAIGPQHGVDDDQKVLVGGAQGLIAGARQAEVKRLVVVGGGVAACWSPPGSVSSTPPTSRRRGNPEPSPRRPRSTSTAPPMTSTGPTSALPS